MRRWLLGLIAVAGLLAGTSVAAAPPDVEDVLLTIKVRAILDQDPELRDYNIGVQVVNRVAILFGPLPKLDLGLRAESRLRDLIELRDVRNQLDIVAPVPDFLPNRLPPPPFGGEPRQPRAVVPIQLRTPKPDVG